MIRYKADDIWEEVTYLGYHLHWDLEMLLDLEHRDRKKVLSNVSRLNDRAWEALSSHV